MPSLKWGAWPAPPPHPFFSPSSPCVSYTRRLSASDSTCGRWGAGGGGGAGPASEGAGRAERGARGQRGRGVEPAGGRCHAWALPGSGLRGGGWRCAPAEGQRAPLPASRAAPAAQRQTPTWKASEMSLNFASAWALLSEFLSCTQGPARLASHLRPCRPCLRSGASAGEAGRTGASFAALGRQNRDCPPHSVCSTHRVPFHRQLPVGCSQARPGGRWESSGLGTSWGGA
jgi:hypothetical protein